MLTTIKILDIPITNINKKTLMEKINDNFREQKGNLFIVTANPEIIITAKKTPAYKAALLAADYIVPDGIGVMIAAKILRTPLLQKLPGFELMHDFLSYANTNQKSIYFYGAKPGIAKQAALNAVNLYEELTIAGFMDGYAKKGVKAAREIATTKPDFVFVAMGAPLQEQWIAEFKELFPSSVLIGIGGSLDVLSGTVKRAPHFWTNNNLEWFYRLVTQPARAKRMLKIPLFLMHVVKERITK